MPLPPSSEISGQQPGWLRSGGIDFLVAVLVFVTAFLVLHGRPSDRFHIDEAHKISEAHYYHLFFQKADLKHPEWRGDFYARINPPVAKYLLGAMLSLQGEPVTDGHLQEKFEQLWQDPDQLRKEIPPSQLEAARRGTALFAALCCVVIYFIARNVAGRLAGLIAAGLLLAHPLFLQYCALALTDAFLLFFLSAVVLVLIQVLRRPGIAENPETTVARLGVWKVFFWETLLPTVTLLGAAGTKLNGGLAAVLWIVVVGIGSWGNSAGSLAKRFVSVARVALIPPLLALVLFVAFNPSLYDGPFEAILAMPRVYGDWMIKQAIDPGEAITSFSRKWSETYFHTIARGEMSLHVVSPALPFCGLMWFALIGMGTVLQGLIAVLRGKSSDRSPLVVALWVAIYGAGIVGWIPVDWDRYFLPLIPLQAVLVAVGVCGLGRSVRVFFKVVIKRAGDQLAVSELRSTAAVTGISLVVAAGSAAVTDFSLISPRTLLANGVSSLHLRGAVQRGAEKHPEDAVRLMHYAEFLDSTGVPQAALPFARRAVSRLPAEVSSLPLEALHAAFQFKLAGLEAQLGQLDAARKNLSQSNQRILAIQSRLKTRDPKIDQEFQLLINQRSAIGQQLDQELKQTSNR